MLLSATRAEGITELSGAATEPEIIDLIAVLQKMGAIISVQTDRTIRIEGVRDLGGYNHRALSDRNESASWASAALVTRGDIVCFVDADLKVFASDFVTGVVGPLLTDPGIQLVKAMYDRPMTRADGSTTGAGAGQGGRVTELMARPLLNMHWPQLAGFVQPLGGEYAARRSLLEQLPFPVGYGVELGMLVDALHLVGLDALAQVDVGVRKHRHQDGQALGRMAAAIYRTAQLRLARAHLLRPSLTQFERSGDAFEPRTYSVDTEERPPMTDIAEYHARRVA